MAITTGLRQSSIFRSKGRSPGPRDLPAVIFGELNQIAHESGLSFEFSDALGGCRAGVNHDTSDARPMLALFRLFVLHPQPAHVQSRNWKRRTPERRLRPSNRFRLRNGPMALSSGRTPGFAR